MAVQKLKWHRDTSPLLYDGKTCPYCSNVMLAHGHHRNQPSRDHLRPQSKKGKRRHGLVVVCKGCNEDRGDLDLGDWWLLLHRGGDHRAKHVLKFIIEGELNRPPPITQAQIDKQIRTETAIDQFHRYEWTLHGLASHPVGDREEGRSADLDDAGRRGDSAD